MSVLCLVLCRQLELEVGAGVLLPSPSAGVALEAGVTRHIWLWTQDMNVVCFADSRHRALVLGVGVPGTLLLLAYPIVQAALLGHQAAAGRLTSTSDFFAGYGQLVEDFRPRLFFWGSIVELRKLALVRVLLL